MPQRLLMDDFTGGRQTLFDTNSIRNNESPDQLDTWCEVRNLSKRRGFRTWTININSKSVIPEQLKTTQMAASSLCRLAIIGRVAADTQRYLCFIDDFGAPTPTFQFAGYAAGTADSNGAGTLTGHGTAWLNNVSVGDYVNFNSEGYLRITAVNSDTGLTTASAFSTSSGKTYNIIPKIVQGSPCGIATFDVSGVQNLFIADGSRAYRWDGTNMYRMENGTTLMPAGKQLLPHKNYLFSLLHDLTTLKWCTLRDATAWPAANSQPITDLQNPIRGGVIYGDGIVIFCQHGMYRVLGDTFDPSNPTYYIQKINVPADFNFRYPRSAVVHEGVLKFLTVDGWYGYIGGPGIEKISQEIQIDVNNFGQAQLYTQAAEAMAESAVGVIWNRRMWCAVDDERSANQQVNNSIYVQDERGKWWKWDTGGNNSGTFTDFAIIQQSNLVPTTILVAGCEQTNKIAQVDFGNSDDGGAIGGGTDSGGYHITREYVLPNDVEFVYADITLTKQSAGNLTVSVSIDRATFIDFTCSMTAGAGTVIKRRIPINRIGKSIRLRFKNQVAAQTFTVQQVEVFWEKSEAIRA